jgi:hypothetical protein
MYFTVEEIQPTVEVVTSTLGPQGNMMEGKHVSKNVILGSPQFGKLWYGDVDGDMEYIKRICAVMSHRTGQPISVVDEAF